MASCIGPVDYTGNEQGLITAINAKKEAVGTRAAWNKPELESLGIGETSGGPIVNFKADAESWYNDDKCQWETPVGEPLMSDR